MANLDILSGLKEKFHYFWHNLSEAGVCHFAELLLLTEQFEQMVNSLCNRETFMSFH